MTPGPLVLLSILVAQPPVPELPGIYFDQAEIAIKAGRLLQARRMLEQPGARSDPRAAILLADLSYGEGAYGPALIEYSAIAAKNPLVVRPMTGAGLAALRLGRYEEAHRWLKHATSRPDADWRAWNGFAVSLDHQRSWNSSKAAYQKALGLAPDNATVWNNYGYSLMLQGQYPEAVSALGRALSASAKTRKIVLNFDLARALAGDYSVQKRPGETPRQWAARLNNAGYAAFVAGDRSAARSLLSSAVEVNDVHFPKAEANLRLAEGEKQ